MDWSRSFAIETRMAFILGKMERNGFLVDKKLIEQHIRHLTGEIGKVDEEVMPQLPLRTVADVKAKGGVYPHVAKPYKMNGELCVAVERWYEKIEDSPDIGGPFTRVSFLPFDLGSTMQVKEYLLDQGWLPDKWNYKKDDRGRFTEEKTSPKLTQEDQFLGVTGTVGRRVADRIKYRHRRSQLEGWYSSIRPDGRISQGISGMTPTARLRHSRIVNIPGFEIDPKTGEVKGAYFGREMRSVFVAREGYKIVGCDAASCQLRMLCHYMGDESYTNTIVNGRQEDGTDPHTVNMKLAGLSSRGQAKGFIYAFLFGAADKKLGLILGGSARRGKEARAKFLQGLPKLAALLNNVEKSWKKRGYLIGLDGRKIYVRSPHMLLVYLLQSAEAIMMKVAMCFMDKRIKLGGYDAKLVATAHDEVQYEVLASHSEDVARILEDSIRDAYLHLECNVEGKGEADIGKTWAETH